MDVLAELRSSISRTCDVARRQHPRQRHSPTSGQAETIGRQGGLPARTGHPGRGPSGPTSRQGWTGRARPATALPRQVPPLAAARGGCVLGVLVIVGAALFAAS
jgi:hypothetical protein